MFKKIFSGVYKFIGDIVNIGYQFVFVGTISDEQ